MLTPVMAEQVNPYTHYYDPTLIGAGVFIFATRKAIKY
jgi:hypothetical protein